jgi:biotin carboxylase
MAKTTILILGGGVMQLPAIKIAGEMGWTTIVADGVIDVPGKDYADYFENIDLKDTEGMIKAALGYKTTIGLDGVFTAGTDFSETVARVALAAALPGISVEAAINASNKSKMREAFRKYGVASPLFTTVRDVSTLDCEEIVSGGIKFPMVVKPVDNMGSRGIRRTDNCNQLQNAVRDALLFSRSGNVIIEEYLEGHEFSIDALIYNNEITICGFADRHIFYPPYFIEMGHTIPSIMDSGVSEEIFKTFKDGVRALGITKGAAKGDIRLSRGKIYIGEIAARLSGGYMSGWTFPYSSGVDLTKGALKIAVGQHPGNLSPRFSRISAERAIISIPGVIKDIIGIEKVKTCENLKEFFLRVSSGDKVRFPENNVDKVGNCIAVNKERSIAISSAEDACRDLFVRLEPSNLATEQFLFGSSQSWVASAFTLEKEVNVQSLENMPEFELNSTKGIAVLDLPVLEQESSSEWHGKSISCAFDEVLEKRYQKIMDKKIKSISINVISSENIFDGVILGKLFYHALIRGGIQGGVWVIDTILKTIEEKKSLLELFSRWKNY